MPRRGQIFTLGARELRAAGAGSVLALADGYIGASLTLALDAPSRPTAGPLGQVGIVRVEGPLSQRSQEHLCGYVDGYDAIEARFRDAITDPQIGSIVLYIDSPGGDVAGLEQAVDRMRGLADAQGKTVYAFVDEMAASAAYWIASGVADQIVVPPTGRVGSIGCIGAYVDESGALAAQGVAVHVFRDPPGKAPTAPMAPVAEIADARIAADVKAVSGRFASAVSKRRDIAVRDIRELNGDFLMGKAAVSGKLADRVDTLEGVIKLATKDADRYLGKKKMRDSKVKALGISESDAQSLSDDDLDLKLCVMATNYRALVPQAEQWRLRAAVADQFERDALESKLAAENAERDRLGVRLVTEAHWRPNMVWADPIVATDPSKRSLKKSLAALSIEELRAEVDSAVSAPLPIDAVTATPRTELRPPVVGDSELSAAEREICRQTGCDEKVFAALKAQRDSVRIPRN